jgi:serine/threonine-protein kinase
MAEAGVGPKPEELPVEAGLRAAYGQDPGAPRTEAKSVLASIEKLSGAVSRVLLRDTADERTPVLTTRTDEIREGPLQDGRYQTIGEIARGGVGVVVKARDADLGRDIAVKVLLSAYTSNPAMVQRFIEEAQIGAQLQHPGIVQVHDIGLRADQRPYFSMQLIKGKTLSAHLQARGDPGKERQKFIGIFEKICQTVAYAHARGVIHRDLKPANVMVGAYGEVKVVDWGFAKVLGSGGVEDERRASRVPRPAVSIIETIRSAPGSVGSQSIAGSLMGTPAYMPPEQALGEVEQMDERSDVFSLGAILCEILTGKPPYLGENPYDIVIEAAEGRITGAYERLDQCGADEELIRLAKRCLAPSRVVRPADAGVVSRELTAYLQSVEDRIRKSEIEAVRARERADAAVAEAEQRRRAHRLTLALAGSILLTILVGGGGFYLSERGRQGRAREAERAVSEALSEADRLWEQARAAEAADPGLWQAAVSAAQGAEALARSDDVEPAVREKVLQHGRTIRAGADEAAEAARIAEKDAAMVARLHEIRAEGLDPAVADAEYGAAFRGHGTDVAALPLVDAVKAITDSSIREELVAALDDWRWARGRIPGQQDGSRLLLDLARLADPDQRRNDVRAAVQERDTARLLGLARTADVSGLGPATAQLMSAALAQAGEREAAVALLRSAREAHPQDFWLAFNLGFWLTQLEPPRYEEATRCYAVALTLRPGFFGALYNLGAALVECRDADAAIPVLQRARDARPKDPRIRVDLAKALRMAGRAGEADAIYEEALAIQPESALDFYKRGVAHEELRRIDEAIVAYEEAWRRDPDLLRALNNLCEALVAAGRPKEAMAYCQAALPRHENASLVWHNLGFALAKTDDLKGAIEALGKAVELDPANAEAWHELGSAYGHVTPVEIDKAIEANRKATELAPREGIYRYDLGWAYALRGEYPTAIREYREAIKLKPDHAPAWDDLGYALYRTGEYEEAERCFSTAMVVDPDLALSYRRLADTLVMTRKAADAVAWFEENVPSPPVARKIEFLTVLAAGCVTRFDHDAAISLYRDALRIRPADADLHFRLAGVYLQIGELRSALDAVKEATKLNPEESLYVSMQASVHTRLGDGAAALEAAKRLVFLRPEDAAAHAQLARACRARGMASESAESCREVLRFSPTTPAACVLIGMALGSGGSLADAWRDFGTIVRNARPEDRVAFVGGLDLAADDRRLAGEMFEFLRGLVEADPEDAFALHMLAHAHENRGEPDEALRCFRGSCEAAPADVESLICLARFLRREGKAEEAVETSQQAALMAPMDPVRHMEVGWALRLAGKTDAALESFAEALRLEPENALLHDTLGQGLASAGTSQECTRFYSRLVRKDSDRKLAEFNEGVGRALLERQEMDDALRHGVAWRTALGDTTAVLEFLGAVHLRRGEYAKAWERYRAALDKAPYHIAALRGASWVRAHAPESTGLREPTDAVALALRATQISPRSAPAWCALGGAQFRAGRMDEAERALERSLELESGRIEAGRARALLSLTYAKRGDPKEAKEQLRRARELLEGAREKDVLLQRLVEEARGAVGKD